MEQAQATHGGQGAVDADDPKGGDSGGATQGLGSSGGGFAEVAVAVVVEVEVAAVAVEELGHLGGVMKKLEHARFAAQLAEESELGGGLGALVFGGEGEVEFGGVAVAGEVVAGVTEGFERPPKHEDGKFIESQGSTSVSVGSGLGLGLRRGGRGNGVWLALPLHTENQRKTERASAAAVF